jgi:DNA-directed RNA polymerase subunit H (RpoH/RPB5)
MEPLNDTELLKIKKESIKILQDRGYTIPAEEASILNGTITIEEFKNMYLELISKPSHPLHGFLSKKIMFRSFMSNIYSKGKTTCLVFFAEPEQRKDKKISSEQLGDFCRLLIETKVNEAILISNVQSSSMSSIICGEATKGPNKIFIQYFTDDELMFNPLEHVFVPKHRILEEDEVRDLKEVDKIMLSQLPKISKFDPICKRMGADEGNVIEVTRRVLIKESLLDEEIAYRVVFTPRIEKPRK